LLGGILLSNVNTEKRWLFSIYSSSAKPTPCPAPHSTKILTPAEVSVPTSFGVKATRFSRPPGFSGDSISLTQAIF